MNLFSTVDLHFLSEMSFFNGEHLEIVFVSSKKFSNHTFSCISIGLVDFITKGNGEFSYIKLDSDAQIQDIENSETAVIQWIEVDSKEGIRNTLKVTLAKYTIYLCFVMFLLH
jgi:hypothetical protein